MVENTPMDDISDIVEFYNGNPDAEHQRLEYHQLEFDLTWRYLDRFLPPNGNLLEIGAASGRYTLGLAGRGYSITAVDVSQKLLDLNRQRLAENHLEANVRYLTGDVRQLDRFVQGQFNAILLMGPLYHLVMKSDRSLALSNCYAHLVEGGVIFSSFISRFGIMGELIRKVPEWIEDQAEVREILDFGRDPDHYPRGSFRGYFATVAEIAPLHENAGFKTILLAGVEPGISADDESYNQLQGTRRQLWLDLFDELSTEPSSLGASRHLLYIGCRPAL